MTRLLQRRKVLQGWVGGMAIIAFTPALRAASSTPATVLADNISLLNIGGVNVVVAVTETDVVLIDTGPKAYAPELVEQLLALSTSTNYTLFNTHWHDDQTGGNSVFYRMNGRIIAHKKTLDHLSSTLHMRYDERYRYGGPPGRAYPPAEIFHTRGIIQIGNEMIHYDYLPPGHTDGDIYVYFRNANIMAVGDMVSPERDPALDWYGGGWLGGRVEAMDILLEPGNDATQFVPSYGPVVSKAQVKAERDMMAFLCEQLVEQIRMGFTAKDSFISGIMNGLIRTFDDPQKFLSDAHHGLRAHHDNLAPNVA